MAKTVGRCFLWTALYSTILDMGYGKMLANVQLLLWNPRYLSFEYYRIGFAYAECLICNTGIYMLGDVIIGFIAGSIGLLLLAKKVRAELLAIQ